EIPTPPPSDISWVKPGHTEILAISSNTNDNGGSNRLPGFLAANSRARSVIASIMAIRNGPAEDPPDLVPNTYKVPFCSKNSSMLSVSTSCCGFTTTRKSVTDSPLTAPSTPNHFDCNDSVSPSTIPCKTKCQPSAARGCADKIFTASLASAGLLPHRINTSTVRLSKAAACNNHSIMVVAGACHSWFEDDAANPEAPISLAARWLAALGTSQPVMGDHFSVVGVSVSPCGSNNATGPRDRRIAAVAA